MVYKQLCGNEEQEEVLGSLELEICVAKKETVVILLSNHKQFIKKTNWRYGFKRFLLTSLLDWFTLTSSP